MEDLLKFPSCMINITTTYRQIKKHNAFRIHKMSIFIFLYNFNSVTHGVYLERWDRIDHKRVKFLFADPRYPNLPSFATCIPTFEQPSKWGDFFGTRLRTYFVPLQTGDHFFYLCKKLLFLESLN